MPRWTALETLSCVASVTLMTHFADADLERGIAWQMARFDEAVQGCGCRQSAWPTRRRCCAFPNARRGWVRPGIMLYGSSPFPQDESAEALGLQPAMTLSSQLIAVQEARAGRARRLRRHLHGRAAHAHRRRRLRLCRRLSAPCADRHAGPRRRAPHPYRRARLDGHDLVDLDGIPDAGIGSPVTVCGAKGLPADDVAAAAGTVSYELLCALAQRVPVVEKE
jgi:alanine racemase